MATLFTKIYQGDLPGFLVAENEVGFAILNRYPNQRGHLLVIPRQEVGHLFDLPANDYQLLMKFVYQVAHVLQATTQAEKIGLVVEGYGVKDHAHIHLLPLNGPGELDISMAPEATDEELSLFASEFAANWSKA